MASSKNTKNGGGQGETDQDDTSTTISGADSGRGTSVAEVSSPDGQNLHDVGLNQELDRETLSGPVEENSDGSDSQTMMQESYDMTIPSFENDRVTKISVKPRNGSSFKLEVSTFEARDVGSGTVNELEEGVQNLYLPEQQSVFAADQEGHTLTYTHGKEVPTDVLEKVRNRGEKHEVRELHSALADHLKEFEKAEDCYLLPVENGLLVSSAEISTANIADSTVYVEQRSRRGKVFLGATMSQDISYRPGQENEGGNFFTLKELGKGTEGPVYIAMDVRTGDMFAVKKINIIDPESGRQKLHGRTISAFLKLTDCEQTCRPYGVIVDEDDNCVYFLMEKLEGDTMKTFVDGQQTMDIELAVGYTIHVLRALQYIHSQKLVHNDVTARNVIFDGPRAIVIDTTGAGKTSFVKHFVDDRASAIGLLNLLLSTPEARHSKKHIPWTPSADDMDKYDKQTLQKLESLVKEQTLPTLSTAYTVEKLIEDLQQILQELKGVPNTSDTVDRQDSLDNKVPSPPNIKLSPEGTEQVETLERLKKQIEELTEEKEKYRKGLSDAEKKLKEEENRVKELHESRDQLSNMVRATEEDLVNLEGVLKVARKKWKSEVERLETENQKKQEMLDRAEQEKQELKAEISKLQDRAKQNEGHRVED